MVHDLVNKLVDTRGVKTFVTSVEEWPPLLLMGISFESVYQGFYYTFFVRKSWRLFLEPAQVLNGFWKLFSL